MSGVSSEGRPGMSGVSSEGRPGMSGVSSEGRPGMSDVVKSQANVSLIVHDARNFVFEENWCKNAVE